MKKLRVILDIAFLGHGFDFPLHQRGAHRVVTHLFEGLVHSTNCEPSFVATSNLAGAYDFLLSRGVIPRTSLRFKRASLIASRLSRLLAKRIHRTYTNRSLPARACRRVMAHLAQGLARGESRLTARELQGADIYHSSQTPIPDVVRGCHELKQFITINDLIPVVNPEYYEGDIKPFAKGLVNSITEETYAFCISAFVRDQALRFTKLRPERTFVTPLAASPAIFHSVTDPAILVEARKRYGIPAAPYFLALSSHDRHKNFDHVIECFGKLALRNALNHHNLVIAGPNPQYRSIVHEAATRFPAVKDRIIVTGFIAEADLAAVYSGATAFLFPSLAEGFGMPPLEAMQCGVPVISSNTTSMPEVVGDAGVLLSPTDQDAWCAAMQELLREDGLRRELSLRSLKRATLFSWDRFIEETLRGYRSSLQA